jgi:8-oxo-dGTP pyrophosphatase MutT (NUDIX family)
MNSDARIHHPEILSRQVMYISPWVGLESITLSTTDGTQQTYHAIRQADYVQVLCMTKSGLMVLVRQFRPIPEITTFELPSGLRDGDDDPESSARREVEEETGLTITELVPLIDSFADVGRLTNRLFGYFAVVLGQPRSREEGIEPLLISGPELRALAASGRLGVPSQIGLLYLAAINRRVQTICADLGFRRPPWMAD